MSPRPALTLHCQHSASPCGDGHGPTLRWEEKSTQNPGIWGATHIIPGRLSLHRVLCSQGDAAEGDDDQDHHLKVAQVDDVVEQAPDPAGREHSRVGMHPQPSRAFHTGKGLGFSPCSSRKVKGPRNVFAVLAVIGSMPLISLFTCSSEIELFSIKVFTKKTHLNLPIFKEEHEASQSIFRVL